MDHMKKLPLSFYQQKDVVSLSQQLLGKFLFTYIDNILTGGMIVETEAYAGEFDRASHAYRCKKTKRNSVMFENGGVAYIYICYGIHHLVNVVTNIKNIPHAILIRAIEPIKGVKKMLERRKFSQKKYNLTSGPGALTKSLAITKDNHNGTSLIDSSLFITFGKKITKDNIISSPRIGVSYAKEDAYLPWRFRIKNNPWTSRAN